MLFAHLPSICLPVDALPTVVCRATLPSADGVDNADVANCGRPADTYAAAKFGSVPIIRIKCRRCCWQCWCWCVCCCFFFFCCISFVPSRSVCERAMHGQKHIRWIHKMRNGIAHEIRWWCVIEAEKRWSDQREETKSQKSKMKRQEKYGIGRPKPMQTEREREKENEKKREKKKWNKIITNIIHIAI